MLTAALCGTRSNKQGEGPSAESEDLRTKHSMVEGDTRLSGGAEREAEMEAEREREVEEANGEAEV